MFALFSTEPGEHLERYSVFKFDGERVEHLPIAGPIELFDITLYQEAYELTIQTDRGPVNTEYWHTGWQLVNNGREIPVYDFLYKDLIFPEVPRLACEFDFPFWCNYRINDHKITYSRFARRHGIDVDLPQMIVAVEPENVLPKEKGLPTFVAEALIKSAKDAGTDCPISIIPFKDCSKISVTNCYHCFEASSLEEWYKKKKICPLCKTEIISIVTIET